MSLRVCVFAFTTLACAAASGADNDPRRVTLLRTPDEGLQPQAAIGADGVIHLIYFKGEPSGGDLFYVRSGPDGAGFGAPVRVNSQPGSAVATGTIRGGQLALGGRRVHVAWNGSMREAGGGAPMLYARSDEGGTAFEPQRNLMRRTSVLDGGGTVAADGKGNVYVGWHGRANDDDGDGREQHGDASRRMWVARSSDDGATFAAEEPALDRATGACACCATRALADSRGTVYVLYRAAAADVDRDMYLLTSRDRGAGFRGVRLDPWRLGTCPMSSAALSEGAGAVLAAWETRGQVYCARVNQDTSDVSEPFAPPGAGGARKHPAVAGNAAGEVLLAWAEGTGWSRGGDLAWQVFDRGGRRVVGGAEGRLKLGIAAWSLPTVVARPNGEFVIIH